MRRLRIGKEEERKKEKKERKKEDANRDK